MSKALETTSNDWDHQDRIFVAMYIETGLVVPSAQQAYQIADPVKAGRTGNRFLKRNRSVFNLVLERQGITDTALAKVVAEGLKATKVTYAKFQGKIEDSREDIDHHARISAAKVGLTLTGHLDQHKQRDMDDEQRSTGPVILPVRHGMELPNTAMILDAEIDEGGDEQDIKGEGLASSITNPLLTQGPEDISGLDALSEKKPNSDENETEEEW